PNFVRIIVLDFDLLDLRDLRNLQGGFEHLFLDLLLFRFLQADFLRLCIPQLAFLGLLLAQSDHEFANELHFKLKSMLHFERDIGDSANVSAKQQKRDRYEEAGDEQHIGTTVMVKGVVATMVVETESATRWDNSSFHD
ncbi:GL15395, partial [Drosophila persimilis]